VHAGLAGAASPFTAMSVARAPGEGFGGAAGRNGRANSELAEQTATRVKQSGPVLVKFSKYCVKPAAGSGACPSHQV